MDTRTYLFALGDVEDYIRIRPAIEWLGGQLVEHSRHRCPAPDR